MEFSSSKIKKFLIFQEIELSSSNIKECFIFSQKKAFLISQEMKLSYIFGNGNPEKISGNRTILYFRKQLSRLQK